MSISFVALCVVVFVGTFHLVRLALLAFGAALEVVRNRGRRRVRTLADVRDLLTLTGWLPAPRRMPTR